MAEPPPPFKRPPPKKKTPAVGFFGQEDSFEGDMRVAKRGLTCSIFLLLILMLSVAYCGTRGETAGQAIDEAVDAGSEDAH